MRTAGARACSGSAGSIGTRRITCSSSAAQSMARAAAAAGFVLERRVTVTPSAWLDYQWGHLFTYPREGEASPYWRPAAAAQPGPAHRAAPAALRRSARPQRAADAADGRAWRRRQRRLSAAQGGPLMLHIVLPVHNRRPITEGFRPCAVRADGRRLSAVAGRRRLQRRHGRSGAVAAAGRAAGGDPRRRPALVGRRTAARLAAAVGVAGRRCGCRADHQRRRRHRTRLPRRRAGRAGRAPRGLHPGDGHRQGQRRARPRCGRRPPAAALPAGGRRRGAELPVHARAADEPAHLCRPRAASAPTGCRTT